VLPLIFICGSSLETVYSIFSAVTELLRLLLRFAAALLCHCGWILFIVSQVDYEWRGSTKGTPQTANTNKYNSSSQKLSAEHADFVKVNTKRRQLRESETLYYKPYI
jgi:hypothetical protein